MTSGFNVTQGGVPFNVSPWKQASNTMIVMATSTVITVMIIINV